MIFEGSCDTEYWSNGAKIFSFNITKIPYILKDIHIFYIVIIFQMYFIFFCLLNKCSIGEHKILP